MKLAVAMHLLTITVLKLLYMCYFS